MYVLKRDQPVFKTITFVTSVLELNKRKVVIAKGREGNKMKNKSYIMYVFAHTST